MKKYLAIAVIATSSQLFAYDDDPLEEINANLNAIEHELKLQRFDAEMTARQQELDRNSAEIQRRQEQLDARFLLGK